MSPRASTRPTQASNSVRTFLMSLGAREDRVKARYKSSVLVRTRPAFFSSTRNSMIASNRAIELTAGNCSQSIADLMARARSSMRMPSRALVVMNPSKPSVFAISLARSGPTPVPPRSDRAATRIRFSLVPAGCAAVESARDQ